jgi:hypothetical protein
MRRFVAFSSLLLISVTACDRSAPTDTMQVQTINATRLDGATGGNPHFFFLPPAVPNPTFSGVFNPNISPTVEVCTTTGQDAFGHCTSLLVKFDRSQQLSGQTLDVSLTGGHYVVSWRAKDYAVAENTPFRVVVLVGDIQLGYFDMVKIANSYKNADTNEVISRNGTVPIKFRIENGALCGTSTECFEGLVGPAGGTFTINRNDGTKPAGTEFPAGALDDTVTLVITRVTSGECLPTDAPQYQGCYRFTTEPHVDNFNLPATVGVCMLDLAGVPYFNDQQLRLWKWSEVAGEAIQELERVTIDYLNCPAPTTLSARTGSPLLLGAVRAGSWLLKPLAAVFGPTAAYATMIGYEGGKLSNFSVIGWVRPLAVEIKAGDNQTGPAGSWLPAVQRVQVVNKYGLTKNGVSARVVTFTPSGDGAAISPTLTNLEGFARTEWKLSTVPGANTLLARTPTSRTIAPAPYEAEAVFKAIGQ